MHVHNHQVKYMFYFGTFGWYAKFSYY